MQVSLKTRSIQYLELSSALSKEGIELLYVVYLLEVGTMLGASYFLHMVKEFCSGKIRE